MLNATSQELTNILVGTLSIVTTAQGVEMITLSTDTFSQSMTGVDKSSVLNALAQYNSSVWNELEHESTNIGGNILSPELVTQVGVDRTS